MKSDSILCSMLCSQRDMEQAHSTNETQRLNRILYKLQVFQDNGGIFREDIPAFNASMHYNPALGQANCISSACGIRGYGQAPYEIGLRQKLVLENGVWRGDINKAPITQCDKTDLYETYGVFVKGLADDGIVSNIKKSETERYFPIVAALYENKLVLLTNKGSKVPFDYFDYHATLPVQYAGTVMFSELSGNIHLGGETSLLDQQQFKTQRLSPAYYKPDVFFVPKDDFLGLVVELTDTPPQSRETISMSTPWFSAP